VSGTSSRQAPGLPGLVIGLAGAAALLLTVSLFLDWYELSVATTEVSVTLSGWRILESVDALLVLCGIGGLGFAFAGRRTELAITGVIALALVLVVVLTDTPNTAVAESGRSGVEVGAEIGQYVALGGAIVLAAAGMLAVRDPDSRR